jgi:hypothetical protein
VSVYTKTQMPHDQFLIIFLDTRCLFFFFSYYRKFVQIILNSILIITNRNYFIYNKAGSKPNGPEVFNLETVKVLDYFLFNGEPIGLFRINYLRDVVDHFIIAEFNETFTGYPKISYFSLYDDFLSPFVASGQVLKLELSFPVHLKKGWDRERYQRNIAANATLAFMGDQEFLLIVSDVDELPRKSIIAEASYSYERCSKPYHLEHVFFYYNFNWMVQETWIKQFIINDRRLREFSIKDSIDFMRMNSKRQMIIKNAGWHCSSCFNSSEISRKLKETACTCIKNASTLECFILNLSGAFGHQYYLVIRRELLLYILASFIQCFYIALNKSFLFISFHGLIENFFSCMKNCRTYCSSLNVGLSLSNASYLLYPFSLSTNHSIHNHNYFLSA